MNNDYRIHAAHCCKWHGCKYGDPGCPVVSGEVEQECLCESCYEYLQDEDYYRQVIKDIDEIKRFKMTKNNMSWTECKNCIYWNDCENKESRDGCYLGEEE